MRLIDIVNGPWAVTPEMLAEIQSIYFSYLKGPKIDINAVEQKLGKPLNNKTVPYRVENGVAIIDAIGVIGKRMNLLTKISGGVSTEIMGKDILRALDDPDVKAIVLNIDSPGGTVDGTQELANLIFENRGRKPMVSFTDGMIASAAYWIASAADAIYISGDTNQIGSIGVIAVHQDISKFEENMGVKTTEIIAGKYKAVGSEHKPLSPEDRATIQEKIDYLYSVCVKDVAMNRGVSIDTVLKDMADGRIFVGNQSLDAGLVDGVSTLTDLINTLSGGDPVKRTLPVGGVSSGKADSNIHMEEDAMEYKDITIDALKKERPDLVAQVISGADKTDLASNAAVKDIVASAVSQAEAAKDATIGKLVTDATQGVLANAKKEVMDGMTKEDLMAHSQFHEAAKSYVGNLPADKLEEFPQVVKAAKDAAVVPTEFMSKILSGSGINVDAGLNHGKTDPFAGVFKKPA